MARKKAIDPVYFDNLFVVDDIGEGLGLTPINLNRGSFVEDCVSSGSLSIDLIIGGGWAPGRFSILYGREQSGKSSLQMFAIKKAIELGVPVFHFDYEGAADPLYMSRIGVKTNWKEESTEIEKWKKMPEGASKDEAFSKLKPILYRYYQPETGEKCFRFINRILKTMEDRDSGPVQAIFFIDSLPAMLPESRYIEGGDEKRPMAQLARMFSDNFPLIKTALAKKRCSIVAANQTRLNPNCMFGNPEYEVCGEAVKFYSDCRVKVTKCAIPGGTGYVEEEPCFDGNGIDRYVYAKIMTTKNKSFSPHRTCHVRIWFEEKGQPGRGIDPVYDIFQYLTLTGQIEQGRGRFKFLIPGWEDFRGQDGRPGIKWEDLKKIVLDSNFSKNNPQFDLIGFCRKQIESGEAFEKYFNTCGNVSKDVSISGEVTEEDEDDTPDNVNKETGEVMEDGGSLDLD